MKAVKYIPFFVFLTVFLIINGCSKGSSKSSQSSSNENSSVVRIETHNKPTMLIFDVQGCTYCQKLRNDLKNNPGVKKLSGEMSVYRIDAAREKTYIIPHNGKTLKTDTKGLEYIYGFRGSTPYIVMTDKNFKTVLKIPGYMKPAMFEKALKFVLTKAYKKTDINTYLGLN